MNAETTGIIFGVFLGLLLCILIFRICNSNKKIKSEYDERQEAIRGKSYKYGFYTTIIYLGVLTIFYMTDFAIPFTISAVVFFGLILGISVMAIHSIINEAYWGINNNKKKYAIVFIVCAIINLASGISGIIDGTILQGFQGRMISLECGLMLLVVGIAVIIKDKISPKSSDEEEE